MNDKRYFIDFSINGVYNNNKCGYPDPINAKYYEFACHTEKAVKYIREQLGLICQLHKYVKVSHEYIIQINKVLKNQSEYSIIRN